MPQHKKITESIIGLGKDPENKLTVQKSIPLFSLWRSNMTLAEFKILDAYLSRIDSHIPEKRTVIFTKGELEQLLGVSKISKSDLSKRLDNLGRFVDVSMDDKKIHKIALFDEAQGEIDKNGLWQIKLTCTAQAMKYVFNIEDLGYLRYKLRCITKLTSRYTYILFLYLEQNRFRKTWDENIDQLRHFLNCDSDESYSAFKVFNDRILKRCRKELHEKTECRFSYETLKKGKKVISIRFIIETLPALEFPRPQQFSLDDYEDDTIGFLSGACCPFGQLEPEFTRLEMEQIFQILTCVPHYKLPPENATGSNDLRFRQYHYLAMCYARMNQFAEKRKIKNRLSYLCKIIKSDTEVNG